MQYRRFALSACRAGSTGRRRMNTIAFNDLAAQQARIRDRIDRAIAGVLAHGNYILGPEVEELETQLADFCGARYCVTCANGTDALQLVLMAEGVGPRSGEHTSELP